MNKYHLVTFGCQMNKNDSERISGLLDSLGWKNTVEAKAADLLIINSCSVRQSAEHRAYSFIKNWQKLRQYNPNLIIAVTGCMPGRDKDGKLKKTVKGVDLFFGIEELVMLPNWLNELNSNLNIGKIEKLENYLNIVPKAVNKFQSFVTIQTGCDNFCTYCVVPHARGREKNRKLIDIKDEIQKLADDGCVEVTLLGQVVNNYKIADTQNIYKSNIFKGKDDFAALLWEINNIKGIKRINFTASDPQYFSEYQIQALGLSKMVNYLHLPVQSGDDEILKKMNRKYTVKQYVDLVKKIKKHRPHITIGTDLIIGFPTESKKQFANTLELYRKCQFDVSYPAMYSARSGTAAAAFEDDVSLAEKKIRWKELHELMEEIAYKNNQKYLNKNIEVLVEDYKDGIYSGRSSEMKFVQLLSDKDCIGEIVTIKVNRASTWVLRGEGVEQ